MSFFKRYLWLLILVLLCFLLILFITGVSYGALSLSFSELIGGLIQSEDDKLASAIIYDMRLPRVILAALIGSALSVAGLLTQTLVRNPLADPYLLGIANGASLFAVSGITLGLFVPQWLLSVLGATSAFILVMMCANRKGVSVSPMALVLCGVTISSIGASLTTLMMILGDEQALSQILRWLMGSLVGTTREHIIPLAIALPIIVYLAYRNRHYLDLMLLGDEKSQSIGVNLTLLRWQVAFGVLLLTGMSVASAGVVGFIGLLVPHICRLLVGGSHKHLIPITATLGAVTCVFVDIICRWLLAPNELPLSVPLALITAPLLLSLIRRQTHAAYR